MAAQSVDAASDAAIEVEGEFALHDSTRMCGGAQDVQQSGLPAWAAGMMRRGQLHVALTLSSEYRPRGIWPGLYLRSTRQAVPKDGKVVISLPTRMGSSGKAHHMQFVQGFGHYGGVASIYYGDESLDGKTIYVCFLPADPIQTLSIMGSKELEVTRWGNETFKVTQYIKERIRRLWESDGLGAALLGPGGLHLRHPGYRWVFTGESHGGVLAQAVGLRFEMELRRLHSLSNQNPLEGSKIYVVGFNGYRWAGTEGHQLVQKYLGDRAVYFVATRHNGSRLVYDEVPQFPPRSTGAADMPGLYAMDVGSGQIWPCLGRASCPGDVNSLLHHAKRLGELHFTHSVREGLDRATATLAYGKALLSDCPSLCDGLADCCPKWDPKHCLCTVGSCSPTSQLGAHSQPSSHAPIIVS